MSNFLDYAKYYNLLYQDKNYDQEVDFIVHLIKKHHPHAKTILDLGCGTGKHASILKERGYDLVGVDLSKEMISIAKNNYPSIEFICTDFKDLQMNKKFDVVISLFHVLSYQTKNEDIDKFFQCIRAHLNYDGVAIFDYWYGPAVLTIRPEARIKRLNSQEIQVTRFAETKINYEANIATVEYDLFVKQNEVFFETKESHPMRYFFTPEIKYYLSRNELIHEGSFVWECLNKIPDQNSWSVYSIIKK